MRKIDSIKKYLLSTYLPTYLPSLFEQNLPLNSAIVMIGTLHSFAFFTFSPSVGRVFPMTAKGREIQRR